MLHWSLTLLAGGSLAGWIGLIGFRGGFWRAKVDAHLAPCHPEPSSEELCHPERSAEGAQSKDEGHSARLSRP